VMHTATSASAAGGLESIASDFCVSARPFETVPMIHRSIAVGVCRRNKQRDYQVAIRVQRPGLLHSDLVRTMVNRAKGEADVRMIGRLDKRVSRRRVTARRPVQPSAAASGPWFQNTNRPLLIGSSIGHVRVTAGSLGAFVTCDGRTSVLSNNHVLANENHAAAGDSILQRAVYDGGVDPGDRVAQLDKWIALVAGARNLVDAATAVCEASMKYNPSLLRAIDNGADRTLSGLGPTVIEIGTTVYKTGRTTGATEGRVTAFAVDNVVVGYDIGNLRFDDQIEIEGAGSLAFSDGGDSGSLIVDADMRAVALLFAGGDSGGSNGMGLTYANPIHTVLSELGATLLS